MRYLAARRTTGGIMVHGTVEADSAPEALTKAQTFWPGCGIMPPRAARLWMRANGAVGNEARQRAAGGDR
jgi:hypothetical protein